MGTFLAAEDIVPAYEVSCGPNISCITLPSVYTRYIHNFYSSEAGTVAKKVIDQ